VLTLMLPHALQFVGNLFSCLFFYSLEKRLQMEEDIKMGKFDKKKIKKEKGGGNKKDNFQAKSAGTLNVCRSSRETVVSVCLPFLH